MFEPNQTKREISIRIVDDMAYEEMVGGVGRRNDVLKDSVCGRP